jgi:hypothetical protein
MMRVCCTFRNTDWQIDPFPGTGHIHTVKAPTSPPEPLMDHPIRPEDLNRLHDEARRLAPILRDEAIEDFWHGAHTLLHRGMTRAQHAANGLSHRLQHHDGRRAVPSA